jgi:hypothetical protein
MEKFSMTNVKKRAVKRGIIESPNKANGLLQQSLLEIAQLLKNANVVEKAIKIIDPKNIESISDGLKKLVDAEFPRIMIKHAISDFQLNDIASTVKAFIEKADSAATSNEMSSKDTSSKKVRAKKPLSKKISFNKKGSKKTPLKKKPRRSTFPK